MPRNYSNKRRNNGQAYGHPKKICPELRTVRVGFMTIRNKEQNEVFQEKAQETFKKEVPNTSHRVEHIGYLSVVPIDHKSFVKTESTPSKAEKKKNFNSRNPIDAPKYSSEQKDSDSDDDSYISDYCRICVSDTHDEMECIQKEFTAFAHMCFYCDETGHYEDKCPSLLKLGKGGTDDRKWRQKWGKKIKKNKKFLQSMSKQPASHCHHCCSIHHNTEFCFLTR